MFERNILDYKVLVGERSGPVSSRLYSHAKWLCASGSLVVCSIIAAALSDSSSVGTGGFSCLCGLVLEEEHAEGSKFRAGLRVSARSAFIWQH